MRDLQDRVSNRNDVIDSRDIIERIEELESELGAVDCTYCEGSGKLDAPETPDQDKNGGGFECSKCDGTGTVDLAALILNPDCPNTHTAPHADEYGDQMNELRLLRALVEEIDQNAGDNARDGVALVRDSYFEDHAREEAR